VNAAEARKATAPTAGEVAEFLREVQARIADPARPAEQDLAYYERKLDLLVRIDAAQPTETSREAVRYARGQVARLKVRATAAMGRTL
jgi:hypothetical protein